MWSLKQTLESRVWEVATPEGLDWKTGWEDSSPGLGYVDIFSGSGEVWSSLHHDLSFCITHFCPRGRGYQSPLTVSPRVITTRAFKWTEPEPGCCFISCLYYVSWLFNAHMGYFKQPAGPPSETISWSLAFLELELELNMTDFPKLTLPLCQGQTNTRGSAHKKKLF